MSSLTEMREELVRIRRVADTLCTAHAGLSEKFARRALFLDLLILALSSWLIALVFIQPKLGMRLTPFDWDSQIWVGLLSIGTFLLTLVQIKTDWKGRSEAHKKALDAYAEVKREAGYLLAAGSIDQAESRRAMARYDMASAIGVKIPEGEFLAQKRRHNVKVALSMHLDTHPSASLLLTRLRFWIRDNLSKYSKDAA